MVQRTISVIGYTCTWLYRQCGMDNIAEHDQINNIVLTFDTSSHDLPRLLLLLVKWIKFLIVAVELHLWSL